VEIYNQHIHLAATDGRLFRKTVMDQLMLEFNASLASVATHYNNAKKAAPVEGLGRAAAPKGLVKPGSTRAKPGNNIQDDDDCFTVLEIDGAGEVARCQSFSMQGDASEKFDDRVMAWPHCTWVMIQGLGPNSGDKFKLTDGEKEIKRHSPVKVEAAAI
jgi:hypothetical protein